MISDEILSEYLDGELSPRRRAEVEKWLAGDAAARQLLEQLRSVGGALRALPRRKLGEDLSRRVLQAADRRILLEGLPGELASGLLRPTPSTRRPFRRLMGRRALAWLAVTAAVVAAILMAEWRAQQAPMGGKGDRQVARDGVARDAEKGRGGEGEHLVQKAVRPSPPLGLSASSPLAAREKGKERENPVQSVVRASPPLPLSLSPPLALADGVLVIHFDVTAETSRDKSLDKLLDGHGITWRCEHEQTRSAGGTEIVSVYVEALPAQAAGVLAAISAQPGVFRSLDISALLGQPAQEIVAEYGHRIEGPPSPELHSPMSAGPSAGPSQPSRQTNYAARQRVLFVVHVLGASGD